MISGIDKSREVAQTGNKFDNYVIGDNLLESSPCHRTDLSCRISRKELYQTRKHLPSAILGVSDDVRLQVRATGTLKEEAVRV